MNYKQCSLLVVLLLSAIRVSAGDSIKPIPVQRVQLTQGKKTWWEPLPVRRRTADRKWWTAEIASGAFTVGDVENSIHALGNCSQSHEVNFLYGRCPSRARYYAISGPLFALATYESWKFKREDDALRDASIPGPRFLKWWLPSVLNAAPHILGIAMTLASTGK
jgi:hypothetical protein